MPRPAHVQIHPVGAVTSSGPGILIFCGNEFAWHRSNLEDFADFYHTGRHRADDPFALMEQHHLKENGVQLARNIDHFGFLKRHIEIPTMAEFYLPVRGPVWLVSQLSATNLLARFERRLHDLVTEWAPDHHGVRLLLRDLLDHPGKLLVVLR